MLSSCWHVGITGVMNNTVVETTITNANLAADTDL